MFRKDSRPKQEYLNCIYDDGGLGDHIARMSAIKYIRDHCPHVTLHLYVPDFFKDIAKNLVQGVCIRSFSEREKYNTNFPCVKTQCSQHDTMATHLVDHAFHVLVNREVEIEHKNYCKLNLKRIKINKYNLPEKYVVMTTGFTAEVRQFYPEYINKICKFIKESGYEVVFLGSDNVKIGGMADNVKGNFAEEIDFSIGYNLINKTSLLEAGKIIANSKCIVGLDNGLLHLAGCTEVPIIYGFTTVEPEHRLPYRHDQKGWNCYIVLPDNDLTCKYCQSRWCLVYDHNFTKCFYTDNKCIGQLRPEKWIEQLKKVL